MTPESPIASDAMPEPEAPEVTSVAPVAPVEAEAPRAPLPAPLVNIWESFVLDQAQRGRTEVQYMVPILISMLSERGVANLRPDDKHRRRLERWRDVLTGELTKINATKPQKDNALQDGFRALDVPKASPISNAETTGQAAYVPVLLFTGSQLEEHKRLVVAQVTPTLNALKELNRQEEVMVRHRLQLMQRLSGYSGELLELGNAVVRRFQASETERITISVDNEADVDAALAALLPPPVQVTYGTVFSTFWQIIERFLSRIMAWEPPAVRALRRRATDQLTAAVSRASRPQ